MYDIAIVGFGPAGAVAASLFGGAGLKTLVVDRLESIYDKPRAIALDHEIMRVFQQLGVVEAIAPHISAYPPSEFRGVDGRVIKRLEASPPPLPLGWPPNLSFTQPPVDAALRACASYHESVTVRLGEEVIALQQSPGEASIELRGKTGRSVEKARYLIACDGANSTVRRLCALELEDLGFDEPWLVVDMLVEPAALAELPDINIQYCEPSRPATYVVGPGQHRRWEIMLHEHENPDTMMQEARVWELLERWVSPATAKLWRAASYRFHALVARSWRHNRVFLAGDAAHQQPPFLGQGMCQGVRDVVNLAWKLTLVLQGKAASALLDTYESERSPHVRRLTETIKTLGRFVCERDPGNARARDEKLLAEMGGTVRATLRQDLVPPLACGFMSSQAHTAKGTLFPQPRELSRDILLDDVIGSGFRLFVSGAWPDTECGPRLAEDAGIDLKVVRILTAEGPTSLNARVQSFIERDGVVRDWFARYRCRAALVRPDNYVFGTAQDAAQLASLLREVARQLA